ncbi:hypothetical protein [Aquimarina sp. SS2-1]|uniref:hypothetical protein n=1 Tax=Aquimarina besae TaxID=3342247 RepID=UPI00366BC29F
MKSETQKISKHIKGSLRDGIFSISSCNRVDSLLSFIRHWRTQKINTRSGKEQLLIFLSKTGRVKMGVFKDITARKKK